MRSLFRNRRFTPRPWRAGPRTVVLTPPAPIRRLNVHFPDGSHVDFDRDDPEWFVCKEHGHYIDSPEHHYVCVNRPSPVVG